MTSSIYLIKETGALLTMSEEPYDSEEILQKLLEDYPSLMAGDQIDSDAPIRWLLVSREMPIPSEQASESRWWLDHLFLDQDGIPTLLELKRSTDTRLRREVVGQMLDYAANAVMYWPFEQIRSRFVSNCKHKDTDPESRLNKFLDCGDEEDFWQAAKTNLQAERIRLLFIAGEIPTELARIVEFLNGQMDPAEALAIEIKQFVAGKTKTIVPRVIGQTESAKKKKHTGTSSGKRWDEESFLRELENRYDLRRLVLTLAIGVLYFFLFLLCFFWTMKPTSR